MEDNFFKVLLVQLILLLTFIAGMLIAVELVNSELAEKNKTHIIGK